MIRGIEGRAIFRDDTDRADFVRRLAAMADQGAVRVYAWALLANHTHLLLRTGNRGLSRSMRCLLTGYAGAFNRRHRRRGHLFQNRYKSIVVEEEPYLLELTRYIHLNPLRAGLVRDLRALERYPWSGHASLCGRAVRPWQATADVLAQFGCCKGRARAAYRAFVGDGVRQGRRPDLQGGGLVRSLGGWRAVQTLRRGREAYMADERVLGSSDFVEAVLRDTAPETQGRAPGQRSHLALATLVRRVGVSFQLAPAAILGHSRVPPAPEARQLLAHVWVERLGRPASDLARVLGQTRGHVSWAAKRGAELARTWTKHIEGWCK